MCERESKHTVTMAGLRAGGDQRERARQKAAKKKADQKKGNTEGLSAKQRKERYAFVADFNVVNVFMTFVSFSHCLPLFLSLSLEAKRPLSLFLSFLSLSKRPLSLSLSRYGFSLSLLLACFFLSFVSFPASLYVFVCFVAFFSSLVSSFSSLV